MLAFPINANFASTITFSCSATAKPLFLAPYNFNVSEPRRFSVFCNSEHKGGDFDTVEDFVNRHAPSSIGKSHPAITGSEVTASPSSKDSDPAVGNKEIASAGELLKFEGGIGVKVSVDLYDDEYNLKIKRIKFSSDEKKDMERAAEQTAHSAGMLFLQAEMLREMGNQLLAQYNASFRSTLTN